MGKRISITDKIYADAVTWREERQACVDMLRSQLRQADAELQQAVVVCETLKPTVTPETVQPPTPLEELPPAARTAVEALRSMNDVPLSESLSAAVKV